jgi:XTP/dITP diphosphohydrolase
LLNLYIEDIIRMKKRIILSSGNAHKVKEIKSILKDLPFEVVSKNDLGYEDFDVEEDGSTLEENALKKSRGTS